MDEPLSQVDRVLSGGGRGGAGTLLLVYVVREGGMVGERDGGREGGRVGERVGERERGREGKREGGRVGE